MPGPVFINEIHYDNDGTDVGEFIEIAGPAGTSLSGWKIVLYNGNPTSRAARAMFQVPHVWLGATAGLSAALTPPKASSV